MELFTSTQSVSNFSTIIPSFPTLLRIDSTFTLRHAHLHCSSRFRLPLRNRGFICCTNSVPKASFNEDSSIGASSYATEEVDTTVAVETDSPIGNKVFTETAANEVVTESPATETANDESAANEKVNEVLDSLNIKVDSDDTYSLLLFGGGAVVVLWLASAVVGAIDSVPLFPKLMELVGLGYTFWFTTRYLLFKDNRDELFAKIEELKQQVLGSATD